MIERRLSGTSLKAIGAEFNIQVVHVMNELQWAERQGIVQGFEDQILSELVPASMTALKSAIEAGNTELALEIFKGTGLLRKQADRSPTQPTQVIEESLEVHVKRITQPAANRSQRTLDVGSVPTDSAQLSAAIEAEVVEDSGAHRSADPEQGMDLANYLAQQTAEPTTT